MKAFSRINHYSTRRFSSRHTSGFTLAELLIALAILGVIATFTIPKILDSGSSSKHNSIVLEAAATVSEAYQLAKLNGATSATSIMDDFTQYMNYVKVDSTSVIDHFNTSGSTNCHTPPRNCLLLHNGAIFWYRTDIAFGATDSTSMIYFLVDPDGVYGGSTTGSSKGAQLFLYYNGRLTSSETAQDATYYSGSGPHNAATWGNADPEYLSWKP